MSEPPHRHQHDAGLTLPEVLIAVVLLGVVVTTILSLVSVALRQSGGSEGRVHVARAEQLIDTWLPADLASTDVSTPGTVDLSPVATPCTDCSGIDLSGANVMQLQWGAGSPHVPTTTVQYQYIDTGEQWDIQRIECVGGANCSVSTVVFDVDAPPDAAYDPNDPAGVAPTWAMRVNVPPDLAAIDRSDNLVTVTFTVDGGGDTDNAGGGLNTITLSAGGIQTSELAPVDFTVPEVTRARSRCGGPITLVLDDSGSIGSAVTSVIEPGVDAFIESFRGTPTQLQIIAFSRIARTVQPVGSDSWHYYVDMTDDAAVDQLKLDQKRVLDSSGLTNWEDALFRALHNQDTSPATTMPKRLVFFTDGVPSSDRVYDRAPAPIVHFNAGPYDPSVGWPQPTGNFHQEGFDRTDVLLKEHPTVELVTVGVGGGLQRNDHRWIQNPDAYTNPSAPPSPHVFRLGAAILADLFVGRPDGRVDAVRDGGVYTNGADANYFLQTTFSAPDFADAMRAAALKDCGGTITIDTKFEDRSDVAERFVYENTEIRRQNGTPVAADVRQASTSASFNTATFDFDIEPGSDFYSIDIVPQATQIRDGFEQVGWGCRSGADVRPSRLTDIDGGFDKLTVDVRPNEALSCILTVRQIPSP